MRDKIMGILEALWTVGLVWLSVAVLGVVFQSNYHDTIDAANLMAGVSAIVLIAPRLLWQGRNS